MKNLFTFLCILWGISAVVAQNRLTKKQIDSLPNTIENQFLKTYSKGKNWHEYKMIDKAHFATLKTSILDSVSKLKKTIVSKEQLITEKQNTITSLKSEIATLDQSLNNAKNQENSISLFGTPVDKDIYNSIVWSIIGILALGMAFFIYKYNNNISITKEAKNNLVEIEEEFENHRKKTIEKEQKLRRQLHDEVNKNRNV